MNDSDYQIPYDWKNGKLPPIEDIRAWLTITKLANNSIYGPRIKIPDEILIFNLNISDLHQDMQYHGIKGFERIYGTTDLWKAAKNEWIHQLNVTPGARRTLAEQGFWTELDYEEFKFIEKQRSIVPGTDRSIQEPIDKTYIEKRIVPGDKNAGISATMIEDETTRHLNRSAETSPSEPSSGISKRLLTLSQVKLPGPQDTIVLGSGQSCGILGRGGMAMVYKIYNDKLEIYRAVKLMLYHMHCHNESDFDTAIRRIETEAKILARLHQENIVQIHNFGDWQGLPFIEMELVNGADLKTLLNKRGPLPTEIVTAIGILVTKALAFAHRQNYQLFGTSYNGLIHRDIKPQNILCSKTGEIKLADFGLAKPSQFTSYTITGNFVGTPQYASPEQLASKPLDARSDIYSLGLVFYEMLTAQAMFPQSDIMSVFAARQANTYTPITKLRRNLPKSLVTAIGKCVTPTLHERFDSALALLDALEDCHRKITKERPESVLEDHFLDRKLLSDMPQKKEKKGLSLFGLIKNT